MIPERDRPDEIDVVSANSEMIEAGVEALREVLGYHEDARTTLVDYDQEAVRLIYSRMRALEGCVPDKAET